MEDMEDKAFLGRGWNFPPGFKEGVEPTVMSSGEESIRQSLWTLFSTSPGERIHRYDYGCPLRKFVFESLDMTTLTLLEDQIRKSVTLFEPRISLESVTFGMDQQKGILNIQVEYTIYQTNRRSNMVYPFYLNEGTDIL